MAEGDYKRLDCGTCGTVFETLANKPGRQRKFCGDYCRGRSQHIKRREQDGGKPPVGKQDKVCVKCGAAFVSSHEVAKRCPPCRVYVKVGRKKAEPKPVWKPEHRICSRCGGGYMARHSTAMYCSKACKRIAWNRAKDPSYGSKRAVKRSQSEATRRRLDDIRRAAQLETKLKAAVVLSKRLAARQRECEHCGVHYSYLSRRSVNCCSDECSAALKRESKRAGRLARKAIERAAAVEWVSPLKVFRRDGWRCYLCGCETPESLRGTYEPNAPELEHMIPLSRGGQHSYANTRCACRACNLIKGDRTVEEIGGPAIGPGGVVDVYVQHTSNRPPSRLFPLSG